MQRVVLVIACLAVGGLAIYGAYQALKSKPDVEPASGQQSEEGPLRSVVVRMDEFQFKPRNVSLRGGLTTEWSNDDDVAHTVTKVSGPGQDFSSDRIRPGETFSRTFVQQGIYRYKCSIHPERMRGKVTVLGD